MNLQPSFVNTHAAMTPANKVVVLTIDGLRLILPQGDIRTVESVTDIDTANRPPLALGTMPWGGQLWPVYCLSGELALLSGAPAARRACVMLATPAGCLGLLCDDARVLVNFAQQSFAMPDSMRQENSPLIALVNYEEGLACITDAQRLGGYIVANIGANIGANTSAIENADVEIGLAETTG